MNERKSKKSQFIDRPKFSFIRFILFSNTKFYCLWSLNNHNLTHWQTLLAILQLYIFAHEVNKLENSALGWSPTYLICLARDLFTLFFMTQSRTLFRDKFTKSLRNFLLNFLSMFWEKMLSRSRRFSIFVIVEFSYFLGESRLVALLVYGCQRWKEKINKWLGESWEILRADFLFSTRIGKFM